ncbi:hypothetical protein V8C44DRAFT_337319 [Trichoderma aethiopicum]
MSTNPNDRITLSRIFQEPDITISSLDYSEPLSRIYAASIVTCFTIDTCMGFLYHVSWRTASRVTLVGGRLG